MTPSRLFVIPWMLVFALGTPGNGQCTFQEVEPNDDKAQATPVTLATGQSLCGTIQLFAGDVDYWRIRTAAAAPAVYRHELSTGPDPLLILSPAIRGLQQASGVVVPGTDQIIQAASGQNKKLVWYGFGAGEEVYASVTGGTGISYVGVLTTTPATPAVIGPFVRGGSSVEFSTLPTTLDTELWIYRVEPGTGKITAVPDAGNDDALSGGPGSRFTRFLPLGRYLIAVGLANMANNLRSPPDDSNRNRPVLDFFGAIAASQPTAPGGQHAVTLRVTDADGVHPFPGTIDAIGEILWFQFDLVERVSFTIPSGRENAPGNVNTTVPFAQTNNFVGQYVYDSSEFPQVPLTICDLKVRMRSPTQADSTGLSVTELAIAMGTTADLAAVTSNFLGNYDPGSSQTMRSGAYSSGPIASSSGAAGEWFSLGLTGMFEYDPCSGRDLVVEVRKCGVIAALAAANDAHNTPLARRIGAVGSSSTFCSSPPATGSVSIPGSPFALVFMVDAYTTVAPVNGPFQTNSAEANVNFDGRQTDGSFGIQAGYCTGGPAAGLNIHSTLTGTPWDLAISLAPQMAYDPCSSPPGQRTPEGQSVNLDFFQPITFLNGLSLPPFPGRLHLPVPVTAPLLATVQGVFLDPAHGDGVRLSAAPQVDFWQPLPIPNPIPGPALDDSSATVTAGCVQFYDQTYPEFFVSSNGRVVFGSADSSGTPSVSASLAGSPWIGAWVDLNPALGGSIAISSPGPRKYRVDYIAVPYKVAPQFTATFYIEFDGNNQRATIGGLQGIQAAPGVDMLLGTSMGRSMGSICGTGPGGQTPFAVGGPVQPSCSTEMLHRFGPTGTLTPGFDRIDFDYVILAGPPVNPPGGGLSIPSQVWNYAWTCQ